MVFVGDQELHIQGRYLIFLSLLLTLLISGCSAEAAEQTGIENEEIGVEGEYDAIEPTDEIEGIYLSTQIAPYSTVTSSASSVQDLSGPALQPAVPEQRRLILEWPEKIRAGDSDLIILKLELDETGKITPTAEFTDHEIRSQPVEVPNVYDTHNIVVQARLDMLGVEHSPSGEISEPMRPGVPVQFIWSVRPKEVGIQRGTIWLHLMYFPHDGGESSRQALSAQTIEIEAVNLLGIGGTPARVIGTVGTFVGAFLGLDKLAPWLVGLFKGIPVKIFTRQTSGEK